MDSIKSLKFIMYKLPTECQNFMIRRERDNIVIFLVNSTDLTSSLGKKQIKLIKTGK